MPETGKDRSSRIEMDYYRQRSGLSRWKVRLAILAFVLGSCVAVYALSDRRSTSPGLVFEGHAAFEQDCDSCHQALTPIGSDSVRTFDLLGISESRSVQHTFDACTSCHDGVSHPIAGHHRERMTAEGQLADKNCAECHVEHQGRDHDLSLVSSLQCTKCHAELSSVCSAGELVQDTQIEAFASKHADFASLKQGDPGTVKFDHAQHLRPGQPGKGKDVIRLRDLEPEMRERYRQQMNALKKRESRFSDIETGDDALVQLDCQSCHQLDGSSARAQASGDELGANFAPLSFNTHCSACHSMNPSGRGENTLAIPHAAPWTEIDQWLRTKSLRPARRAAENPTGIGGSKEASNVRSEVLADWETASMDQSRELVRQQCLKCHEESLVESDASILAARNSESEPLIPSRWLVHGRYDHGAHATVSCKYCHPQAYGEGAVAQIDRDHELVMISGIETCNGCHRPADTPTPSVLLLDDGPDPLLGRQSLWASDRCVTCHRYHRTPEIMQSSESFVSKASSDPSSDSRRLDSTDGADE